MRAASSNHRIRALLPQAVAATAGVVVVPTLLALGMVLAGLPEPQIAIALVIGLTLAFASAAVGSAWWLRHKESVEVSFGELMLWRWFRRHRAEETIDETSEVLVHPVRHSLTGAEQLDMLHELAAALEVKDPYTHGHSRRVERHAYRTAVAMGLPLEEIESLRLAASLHDVGKIDVPDAVLRKPGPLTKEEVELVRRHPVTGAELVQAAASAEVTQAILHHHESWDGTGYPSGLAGTDIPLAARIIAVADSYDAITSARPYKVGSARREAVQVLEAGAGVQFDPEVVKAFISTLPSALPALAGLLLLAWPARVVRKATVWAKSVGAGSVTTAATTAGMAVLVGTAGIGAVQHRPPMQPPAAVTTTSTEVDAATTNDEVLDIQMDTARKPKRSGRGDEATALATSEREQSSPVGSLLPEDPATSQRDPGVSDAQNGDSPGAGTGGTSESDDGKYEPFDDPQPDKGKECDKGKGEALDKHCPDS